VAGEEEWTGVLSVLRAHSTQYLVPSTQYRVKPWRAATMTNTAVSGSVRSDVPFYLLAALAGMGTGWVDVMVNDLLFTALLVLMACMLLGLVRPQWPWRWVVVVGVFVPLAELAAYVILAVKPTRAQVYGSFLASLPGIAGAYGGSLMRGVVDNLRQGK
jgi:hypothetical protein